MQSANTVAQHQSVATSNVQLGGRFSPTQWAVIGVLVACALALLLPLLSLGRWMLSRDYYQHFPLLLLAGAGLAGWRLRGRSVPFQGVLSLRVLIWIGLTLVLTATVFVLPSRWAASLAGVSLLIAAINFIGGRQLALFLFGPVLLIAAAVPLPVGFDNWFVVALQNLATWMASVWLDLTNVMHFTTGVSIQTPGQDYYVKDACSGIHSVFAAVAVGMGYGVYRHYRLWRVVLFLAQLLLWVVVANALRVFLTVYGQSRLGMDLSSPAYHEMLGMVTFAVGVLLAISGDYFLRYLNPAGTTEFTDWDEAFARVKESKWLDLPLSPQIGLGIVAAGAAVGLVVSALFFSYSAPSGATMSIEEMAKLTYVNLEGFSEESLPETIGEWRQTGFYSEERGEDSIFGGMVSNVWQYTSPVGRNVIISIDGPYDAWHDWAVCYRGTGWSVKDMLTIDTDRGGEAYYACELLIKRAPIDNAQVLYACIDPEGADVKPPAYFGDSVMGLVRRFGIGTQDREGFRGGVIQLQMMDQRPGEISAEQRKENEALFWLAVEELYKTKVE
ncbi:exosortase U [Planctomycetaceae bacterium SH139]